MAELHSLSLLLLTTSNLCEPSPVLINVGKQITRIKRSSISLRSNILTKEKYRVGVCKKAEDDLVVYNKTYDECIKECRSRYRCTAINLYGKVGVCRLNFQTNRPEVSCPKFIFSEKITWKKKSGPGCESIDCPINHKCVNIGGQFSCRPSECFNIDSFSNGVVFGSSVSFGKSRGFKCHEGFVMTGSSKVTCLESGEWSEAIPICTASTTKFSIDPISNESNQSNELVTTTKTEPGTHFPSTTDRINATNTVQTSESSTVTNITTHAIDGPEHSNETVTSLSLTSSSRQPTLPTLPLSYYSMACDASLPCNGENLECRNKSCFCVFGTVHDPETNTCLTNCDKRGKTFQEYENVTLLDSYVAYYKSHIMPDIIDCHRLCVEVYDCYFLISYNLGNNFECFFYSHDLPSSKEIFYTANVTTYVRDCLDEEKDVVKSNISDTICSLEWTRGPSHCFKFVDVEMTFEHAEGNCEVLGGKLAEPMNNSDNDFLKSHIENKQKYTTWWIGLIKNDRDWVWPSTGVTPSNQYWAPGHPYTNWTTEANNKDSADDKNDDQCAAYDSIYVAWVNEPCEKLIYSICEIDFDS